MNDFKNVTNFLSDADNISENIQHKLSKLVELVQELSTVSEKYTTELGKQKFSKEEMQRLSFLENNSIEQLLNKQKELTLQIKLAEDSYSGFPGLIKQLNEELDKTDRKLKDLRGESQRTIKEMLQALDQGAHSFDSIKGLFVSFIEFNKTMQNINLQMLSAGFQGMSHGYTPYMSQTFDIMTSNRQLVNELEARQNVALVNGISAAVGAVVGTIMSPGMGTVAGMGLAGGISSSVMQYITSGSELMKAEVTQISQKLGVFTGVAEDNKNMMDRMTTFYNARGNMLGGDIRQTGSEAFQGYQGINNALLENEKKFAGKEGFDRNTIGALLTRISMTQQFGNLGLGGSLDMANNVSGLSKITGMDSGSILNIFTDLRLKLDTPVDQLAGRFMQLNRIAQDLAIPLSQVVQDMALMRQNNEKYGFSQEQLMGLYSQYGKQIREGTVSAGQLSDYMKGMAEMGIEKSIGAMALIQSVPKDELMQGFKGDKQAATMLLNLAGQMSQGESGLFGQMVNSPEADFSKIFGATQLMSKYGITKEMLTRMNPAFEQLAYGTGEYFGRTSGDMGVGNIAFSKIMGIYGENTDRNLFDASQRRRGIETLGTTRGVLSMGDAMSEATLEIETKLNNLKQNRNQQSVAEIEFYQKMLQVVSKYGENVANLEITNKELTPLERHYKAIAGILPEVNKLTGEYFEIIKKNVNTLVPEDTKNKVAREEARNSVLGDVLKTLAAGSGPLGTLNPNYYSAAGKLIEDISKWLDFKSK